jgi:hypothetical protein
MFVHKSRSGEWRTHYYDEFSGTEFAPAGTKEGTYEKVEFLGDNKARVKLQDGTPPYIVDLTKFKEKCLRY